MRRPPEAASIVVDEMAAHIVIQLDADPNSGFDFDNPKNAEIPQVRACEITASIVHSSMSFHFTDLFRTSTIQGFEAAKDWTLRERFQAAGIPRSRDRTLLVS